MQIKNSEIMVTIVAAVAFTAGQTLVMTVCKNSFFL